MNDLLKYHFINPQNKGKVKKPTNSSKNVSGFCGDRIEITAMVEDGIVVDLKYKAFGCYAILTAASILSEWAIGKPLAEVKDITLRQTLELMGGDLDEEKENCVFVAVEAYRSL
jgi:nitrogen fixation NifU-like protein